MRPIRLAVCAASVVLFACPPHPPPVEGEYQESSGGPDQQVTQFPTKPRIEARRDDAADKALAQAKQDAANAPNKKRAAEIYLAVRKAYPESTAGQDALYAAGTLYYEAGDFVSARRTFNELLFENPLYEKAADAKTKLGFSALEVGAYRDAYQTLSSVAEHAAGDDKRRLLEGAERAAEGALLFGDALRIAVQFASEARTDEEQRDALERVTNLIEGRVPFVEIARAAQDLSTSNPVWPIVTFKLARVYYHLRDWTRLRETLNRFLEQAPRSPYAPEAQQMLARIERSTTPKPRTVGVLLPLSGTYQLVGQAVLAGIKLALEGSDIELVVKDTQGEVNQAAKAVEDLAFEDGAIAIIGPLLADDSRAAARVADELNIPILTLTRAENITDIGPNVFRNFLTYSAQAQAIADYGTRVMSFKNWAILYPNVEFGNELANDFWSEIDKRGGQIRGAETFNHDQTTFTEQASALVGKRFLEDRQDFTDQAKELAKDKSLDDFRKHKAFEKLRQQLPAVVDFDAIFVPADWHQVGILAPALAVQDIITNACDPKELEKIKKTTGNDELKTVTLFGSNHWSSRKGRSGMPELVERGGKFVQCSIYVDGFFADSTRPATRKFVKQFLAANKDSPRDPNLLDASGYDAGGIFRAIIERSGPRSRDEFRGALASLKNFEGATGRTSFDDKREGRKPLFFLTIDSKGVHEISPNQPANGS